MFVEKQVSSLRKFRISMLKKLFKKCGRGYSARSLVSICLVSHSVKYLTDTGTLPKLVNRESLRFVWFTNSIGPSTVLNLLNCSANFSILYFSKSISH